MRRSLARSKEAATISASQALPTARSTTNGRQVPTDQSGKSATGIPSCRLRGRFAKRVPVDRPGGWVTSWTHAPSHTPGPGTVTASQRSQVHSLPKDVTEILPAPYSDGPERVWASSRWKGLERSDS